MIKYPNELNNDVIWGIARASCEVGIPISIFRGAYARFQYSLVSFAGAPIAMKVVRSMVVKGKRSI
jgi:hypothetical protein